MLPSRADSDNSWTVKREELDGRNYDLKAINQNKQAIVDTRTPDDLLAIIRIQGREIEVALEGLRVMR